MLAMVICIFNPSNHVCVKLKESYPSPATVSDSSQFLIEIS